MHWVYSIPKITPPLPPQTKQQSSPIPFFSLVKQQISQRTELYYFLSKVLTIKIELNTRNSFKNGSSSKRAEQNFISVTPRQTDCDELVEL